MPHSGKKRKNYSRAITILKCLAPAKAQRDISSLILLIRTTEGEAVLRKILALRSDQISQEMSIINEASALGDSLRIWMFAVHHCFTEPLVIQAAVLMSCMPSHWRIPFHTRRVKRHWNRRWAADSWLCLQSGQRPQLGHPRRRRRSEVQILFWRASQAKNLHLGGAHTFHTEWTMSDVVRPSNCAL